MKTLEQTAKTNPVTLSEDAPICHYHTNDTQKNIFWWYEQLQGQDVQFNPLTLQAIDSTYKCINKKINWMNCITLNMHV